MEGDAGQLRIGGLAPRDGLAYRRQIGLASAGNTGLYSRLTVSEHLGFAARLNLIARRARDERIGRVTEDFGLADMLHAPAHRMSMGQRQRLRLSLAFLHQPLVVLLDEPAVSLDDQGRDQLFRSIRSHRDSGRSVLYCAPTGDPGPPDPDLRLRLADGRLRLS